jgi:hypothetical protein
LRWDEDLSAEEFSLLVAAAQAADNATGYVDATFEQLSEAAKLKSTKTAKEAFAIGRERLHVVKYFGVVEHGPRYTNLWFRAAITSTFPKLYRTHAVEVDTTVAVMRRDVKLTDQGYVAPSERYRDGVSWYRLTTATTTGAVHSSLPTDRGPLTTATDTGRELG